MNLGVWSPPGKLSSRWTVRCGRRQLPGGQPAGDCRGQLGLGLCVSWTGDGWGRLGTTGDRAWGPLGPLGTPGGTTGDQGRRAGTSRVVGGDLVGWARVVVGGCGRGWLGVCGAGRVWGVWVGWVGVGGRERVAGVSGWVGGEDERVVGL